QMPKYWIEFEKMQILVGSAMPFPASCPNCAKTYSIDDAMVGKSLRCPGCGTVFIGQPPLVGIQSPKLFPAPNRPKSDSGAAEPDQTPTIPTNPQQQNTPLQNIGMLIFIITAGFGGLEQAGFGFGLRLGLPIFLTIATIGGAIGGVLIPRSARWAGFF